MTLFIDVARKRFLAVWAFIATLSIGLSAVVPVFAQSTEIRPAIAEPGAKPEATSAGARPDFSRLGSPIWRRPSRIPRRPLCLRRAPATTRG